jgi:sugar-specific transcriptional regulator TrmB
MDDKKEIILKLKSLGLTDYEAKAYITLIKYGSMSGVELAKKAGIPQPRIYDVMKKLEERGLISISEGRPARYHSENPELALKRLVDNLITNIVSEYEKAIRVLKEFHKANKEMFKDIVRLENSHVIINKMEEALMNLENELLIAGYYHILEKLRGSLTKAITKGVSACLISYDKEDNEIQSFFDEVRIRDIKGPVMMIVDRKALVTVLNWEDPNTISPLGFYTENKVLVKIFTEHYLRFIRETSELKRFATNYKEYNKRFVGLIRAIDAIRDLQRKGSKIYVKVLGKSIKTKKNIVVEGEPIKLYFNPKSAICRITLKVNKGEISVGDWGAYLEDIEAEVIEVRTI